MFLHLLSDEQRGAFATAADLVAGASAEADLDVERALPDPALYGSPVARNVFVFELTRIVMDGERPSPCAVDFLGRCATTLDVPNERVDRFKSFAAPSVGARPAAAVA